MTATDIQLSNNEIESTFSCFHYPKTFALILSLAATFPMNNASAVTNVAVDKSPEIPLNTFTAQGSNQVSSVTEEITDIDIFRALNDLYDGLVTKQKSLDSDIKEIIEANIWDMYL